MATVGEVVAEMVTNELTTVKERAALFLGVLASAILALTLLVLLMTATFAAASLISHASSEVNQSRESSSYGNRSAQTQQETDSWGSHADDAETYAAVDWRD